MSPPPTVAYTDGACSGNPGPGGWAWAVPDGPWASGADPATTNQRMEIAAALEAVRALPGPLEVVSDSTYVVHCFRDGWWEGWLRRNWVNSQRKPVANRDLWEPLIEAVRTRGDVTFRWVKGHSGDPMNDLVDQLAVDAARSQRGARGGPDGAGAGAGAVDLRRTARSGDATWRPEHHAVAVVGHQPAALGGTGPGAGTARVRDRLAAELADRRDALGDLLVLSGLRQGAETLGAEAARALGLPFVAVLPFPDPHGAWSDEARERFAELLGAADHVVLLDPDRPRGASAVSAAVAARDDWLARVADEALVVWDGDDERVGRIHAAMAAGLGPEAVTVVRPGRR